MMSNHMKSIQRVLEQMNVYGYTHGIQTHPPYQSTLIDKDGNEVVTFRDMHDAQCWVDGFKECIEMVNR